MNKLTIVSIMLISIFSTVGFSFDQNDLNRLYADDKNLAGSDFSGASIMFPPNHTGDYTYHDVDFTNANFTNAYLTGRYFSGCNFSQSNFSQANLSASRFKGYSSKYKSANFSDSDLTNAIFSNVNISNVDFSNADLTEVDFQGGSIDASTKFNGAIFNNTEFINMKIHYTHKAFLTSQNITTRNTSWIGSMDAIKIFKPGGIKALDPNIQKSIRKDMLVK